MARSFPLSRMLAYLVLCLLIPLSVAAQALPEDTWKFDVLHLKSGRSFEGLIVQESPLILRFRCVRRQPGQSTWVVRTTFDPAEIKSIDRLNAEDRKVMTERLDQLARATETEDARMRNLEIKPCVWNSVPDAGLQYVSPWFVLESNAREDIVRRTAVRLEQIYGAYARFLPARVEQARPARILLHKSRQEYARMLQKRGWDLQQLAFFDPNCNQIVCGSELGQMGDKLQEQVERHRRVREELSRREMDVQRRYRGRELAEQLELIREARQELRRVEDANDDIFRKETQRLFQMLYHEAFHAWLAGFVYPPNDAEVPRWLNEGLAQIFETALIEVGELRLGAPDPERLNRVRPPLLRGSLLPLTDLLKSKSENFLVRRGADRESADRYYLASWLVAFYLTFERRLIGTPEFDDYVRQLKRGVDPVEAFRLLVGQPLDQFEKALNTYARSLRSDGSVDRTLDTASH